MLEVIMLIFRMDAALDIAQRHAPESYPRTVVEETSRPACENLNAYLRANLAPGHPCAITAPAGR